MFDADNSVTTTDGLGTGDRIYMIINLTDIINETSGLPPRDSISGKVQPELGSPGIFELSVPAVLTTRIIDLW
jgi:archaellin